ncbi:MAG: FimV/HubP family polar landmark protein [Pseudomonadota bacterium]
MLPIAVWSGSVQALGLGQASVRSYYEQPLDARIDLISRSEAEMATVTAGLASPADFQVLGLQRGAIGIPLEFTINRDLADPHIRVTSDIPMTDPVVQLVVEVVWSSGRMLRQYTLFLDPPTFPAPAPLPATPAPQAVAPAQRPVPEAEETTQRSTEPDLRPAEAPAAETSPFAESQPAPLPPPTSGPSVAQEDAVVNEPVPAVDDGPAAEESTPVPEESTPVPAAGPPFDPAPGRAALPALADTDEMDVAAESPSIAGTDGDAVGENESEAVPDTVSEAVTESAAEIMDPIPTTPAPPPEAELESVAGEDTAEASSIDPDPGLTEIPPETVPEMAPNLAPDRVVNEATIDAPAEADTLPDEAVANVEATAVLATETDSAGDEGSGAASETIEAAPKEESVADAAISESALVAPAEPESAPEDLAGPDPEPLPEADAQPEPVLRAVLPTTGQGLPGTIDVQRGDTLWGLSRTYAEAQGVSINQVMLAVQQANPSAFLDSNINRMMAGEVLRMPSREDTQALSARDAMLEVMRQEALYRTRWDVPASPDEIPTVDNLAAVSGPADGADSPGAGAVSDPAEVDAVTEADGAASPEAAASPEVAESRLELIPPSDGAEAEALGLGQGGGGETGVSTGESVVQELARTQEELANARQENAYLAERVAELEAELTRDGADDPRGVADTNLAEMEERLRQERLAGDTLPEVDLSPVVNEDSWLLRFGGWIFGAVALLVAALVVFLRRQRDPEYLPTGRAGGGREARPDQESGAAQAAGPDQARVPEPQMADAVTEDNNMDESTRLMPGQPEAMDAEDRLNLARAYLAMGKKSDARDQLEEVVRVGEPDQVREAREMLGEL